MLPEYAKDLRRVVERATPLLEAMSDESTRRRPKPGKWSPREVVGHLIDSASNNHQRFVRALFQDALAFPGYDQDAWVSAQRYHDAPWDGLVALWRSFNLQIARVMEAAPEEARTRPRSDHNLDQLAWKPIPRDEPTTLDYFMHDYVEHMKHHLRQILKDF